MARIERFEEIEGWKKGRELRVWQYVSNVDFKRMYDLSLETSRLISGFMKYLQQSELRGSNTNARCKRL